MKSKIILLLFILNLISCGTSFDFPEQRDLSALQPNVISIDPKYGTKTKNNFFKILFSHALDPKSISSKTVCLINFDTEPDPSDLSDDIQDDKVVCIKGVFELDDVKKDLSFSTVSNLKNGKYGILVTNNLKSIDGFPFNQTPGETPTPFWSFFEISENLSATRNDNSFNGDENSSANSNNEPEIPKPSWIIINEILYDIPGSDTNGQVFIELLGEAGGNIGDYQIVLVNGDNGKIYDSITIDLGKVIPEDGIFLIADKITGGEGSQVMNADLIENFDPQNGADCIQLIDSNGNFVDAIGYGPVLSATAENGFACYEGNPAEDVPSGQSLSRVDYFDLNDNQMDFIATDPTPGETSFYPSTP